MLKGLASDGGLFIPEQIPSLPADWQTKWRNYSFQELAFEIFSLYIAPSEISPIDLKDIIARSYGTFRYAVYPVAWCPSFFLFQMGSIALLCMGSELVNGLLMLWATV